MKRIYPLGYNRYIHLDSYGKNHVSHLGDVFVGILVIAVSAMTVGAALNIDITKTFTAPTQQTR